MRRLLYAIFLFSATAFAAFECPKNVSFPDIQPIYKMYKSKGALNIYNSQLKCFKPIYKSNGGSGGNGTGNIQSSNPNDLVAVLSDVDPATGSYTCNYYYKDSGVNSPAISCSYVNYKLADRYRRDVAAARSVFSQDVRNMQIGGTQPERFLQNTDAYPNVYNLTAGDGAMRQAFIKLYQALKNFIENNDEKLKHSINNTLSMIENLYSKYTNGNAEDRIYTFATFVSGVITLDPEIVEKYDNNTGKIKISQFWKTKASATASAASQADAKISDTISKAAINNVVGGGILEGARRFLSIFFGGSSQSQQSGGSSLVQLANGSVSDYKIASWLDIFELRLWGFYYDLMSKFDIAYGYLINYMLFVMASFFGLWFGGKSMLNKYLEKRNIPGASDMWTKWTAILLSVGIFYVSPASKSTIDSNKPDFYYNNTMIKEVIRKIATEGSRFATAFSDTGLAAYLRFVAHKEYLVTAANIKNEITGTILPRQVYFLYENPLANICIKTFGAKNANDYKIGDPNKKVDPDFIKNNDFFKTNKLVSLNPQYCDTVVKEIFALPYEQYTSLLALSEQLNDLDNEMAYATEIMTYNLYSLQQKFGWINVFTVPFSYYIMKYNDMFLDKGIDYEKVNKKAKEYVKNFNLKEAGMVGFPQESNWETLDTVGNAAAALSDKVAGMVMSVGTSMTGYFMMPGFKQIFDFIQSTLDGMLNAKLLGDIRDELRKRRSVVNILGKVKSVVGKIVSFATRFTPVGIVSKMSGFISNAFSDPALLKLAIPLIAFLGAVVFWKFLFKVFFITLISFIILLKIVLYFVDLLVYFVVSIFVVLWAFTIQSQQLILNYLKRGLVLLVTPTLIVFTTFIFIFVYELMNVLYIYLLNVFIEVQSINNEAYNKASWQVSGLGAEATMGALSSFIELVIQLIAVFLAYVVIYKGTDWILETIGLGDSKLITSQATQETTQKGERYANPLQ